MKRRVACSECNAEFILSSDVDDAMYKIASCCFCGTEIDEDCIEEIDEE